MNSTLGGKRPWLRYHAYYEGQPLKSQSWNNSILPGSGDGWVLTPGDSWRIEPGSGRENTPAITFTGSRKTGFIIPSEVQVRDGRVSTWFKMPADPQQTLTLDGRRKESPSLETYRGEVEVAAGGTVNLHIKTMMGGTATTLASLRGITGLNTGQWYRVTFEWMRTSPTVLSLFVQRGTDGYYLTPDQRFQQDRVHAVFCYNNRAELQRFGGAAMGVSAGTDPSPIVLDELSVVRGFVSKRRPLVHHESARLRRGGPTFPHCPGPERTLFWHDLPLRRKRWRHV
jgi:hypothetical protein